MSWTRERAWYASNSRTLPADHPEMVEARRRLKSVKLEEYVERVVNEAPALTYEQIARIKAILNNAPAKD